MAKYTELFSEYLERGGQLPASFALIDGFEDIFKLHYCDKEIGFETEALFFMKLERTARINVPFYADKIRRLASAYAHFDVPAKVRYERGFNQDAQGEQNTRNKNTTLNGEQNTSNKNTTSNGEQNGYNSELPFDVANASPSMKTHNDAFTNQADGTYHADAFTNQADGTYHADEVINKGERQNETRESGYTPDEAMREVEFLNKEIEPLIQMLLDEFKRLFMQIY